MSQNATDHELTPEDDLQQHIDRVGSRLRLDATGRRLDDDPALRRPAMALPVGQPEVHRQIHDARPDAQSVGAEEEYRRRLARFEQTVGGLLAPPPPTQQVEIKPLAPLDPTLLEAISELRRRAQRQVQLEHQVDVSATLGRTELARLLMLFRKPAGQAQDLDEAERATYNETHQSLMKVRKLLALADDAPLTDEGLTRLLLSSDPSHRAAAEGLLSNASLAARSKKVVRAAMENDSVVPAKYLLGSDALDDTELQTSYIKAMRAKIANTMFDTDVRLRMQKALKDSLGDVNLDMNRFIANVGFNRIMTANNMLGASLASDIDFKLVLDDIELTEELKKILRAKFIQAGGDPGQADAQAAGLAELQVAALKRRMYHELERAEVVFRDAFGLTLEVQPFALKDLALLVKQALSDEAEKNFLSTAFENQVLMSGNDEVRKKFLKIIREKLIQQAATDDSEPGLPVRNFNQYLGESDKGSIRTLKHLAKVKQAMDDVADRMAADPEVHKRVLAALKKEDEKEGGTHTVPADLAAELKKPGRMSAALADDVVSEMKKKRMFDAVPDRQALPMFVGQTDDAKRFKYMVKNLKAFTVDGHNEFVGSSLASERDWIYSNKFGGCRLNDFFDATSAARYRSNKGVLETDFPRGQRLKRPVPFGAAHTYQLDARYDNARYVARAVNRFAVQLQDRMYELLAGSEHKSKVHKEIDDAYHRVTADDFGRMLANPRIRRDLLASFEAMVADLELLDGKVDTGADLDEIAAFRKKLRGEIAALREAATALTANADTDPGSVEATTRLRRQLGFKLFSALSTAVEDTAVLLDPSRPVSDSPRVRQVAPRRGSVTDTLHRKKTSISGQDAVSLGSSGSNQRTSSRRKSLTSFRN